MKTSQILRVIWLSVLLLLPVSELVAQESRPKREFRGAWIQCVNGQFLGLGTQEMQRTLSYQLDELQKDASTPLSSRCAPSATPSTRVATSRGAAS